MRAQEVMCEVSHTPRPGVAQGPDGPAVVGSGARRCCLIGVEKLIRSHPTGERSGEVFFCLGLEPPGHEEEWSPRQSTQRTPGDVRGSSCLGGMDVVENQAILCMIRNLRDGATRGADLVYARDDHDPHLVVPQNSRRTFFIGFLRFASHGCTGRDSLPVSPSPTAANREQPPPPTPSTPGQPSAPPCRRARALRG